MEKIVDVLDNKIIQISRMLDNTKSVISFPNYNDEFLADYAKMIRALFETADIKVKMVTKCDEYDELLLSKGQNHELC